MPLTLSVALAEKTTFFAPAETSTLIGNVSAVRFGAMVSVLETVI